MILEIFPLGFADTNAILIGCPITKKALLLDPAQGSCKLVMQRVEQSGLSLERVFLTHSHWDHIVDAAQFKNRYGIPLFVHPEDAGNLEVPGTDGLPLFFPIEGVKPDGYLADGDVYQVGELQLQVIHTPGHSPGSVCFYFPQEQVIFTGDTLFKGTIGKITFPNSSPQRMLTSLQKLAALPPETKVYPGHGRSTTIGQERQTLLMEW